MITPAPEDWRTRAERSVARGERIDRFIPRSLLDSPLSLLGYWWGTSVGLVWGTLLSTGRIRREEGLWVFTGMPNWAFGRGGVCVGGCFLTGDVAPSTAILRHEAIHARQWRRYGFLMPVLYLLSGRNPLTNRFEILAGLEDGNYIRRGP